MTEPASRRPRVFDFIRIAYYAWKHERILSRLINLHGIVWYMENDEKIDEFLEMLYPLKND